VSPALAARPRAIAGVDDRRPIADSRHVHLATAPLVVLLATAPLACSPNPAFDADGGATPADTGSAPTSSPLPTSAGPPDSTSQVSNSGPPVTTGDASSTATTTSAATTGDASTTGGATSGLEAGVYTVPAVIGTCVFAANPGYPQHAGPLECSGEADAINDTELEGLMMLDVEVVDIPGQGRPARPYLRFDIPPEFAGADLVAVTLFVQVADGVTDLPQSGEVWLSEPFVAADLDTTAPTLTKMIAPDQGEVQPDQWITWQLSPALLQPGSPLHLALEPVDNKGVMLRGASTDPGAPYLELTVQ